MAIVITKQPQSYRGPTGPTALFSFKAEGDSLKYNWQILKAGNTEWASTSMPGNKTDTLSVETRADRNGNQYRCIVTDVNGSRLITNPAILIIDDGIPFLIQPSNLTAIADAIRIKTGSNNKMTLSQMIEAINNI